MEPTLTAESTLTARYQTTVPNTVRKALRLRKRDKIRYSIEPDGRVILTRAGEAEDDPVLGHFLHFLARDINGHPERLHAVESGLLKRVRALVKGAEIDLDAPLADEDEQD